jgi:hypothetical protein
VLTAITNQTTALNITLNSIDTDVSLTKTNTDNIDLKVAQVWNQLGLNPADPVNYQVTATWDEVL